MYKIPDVQFKLNILRMEPSFFQVLRDTIALFPRPNTSAWNYFSSQKLVDPYKELLDALDNYEKNTNTLQNFKVIVTSIIRKWNTKSLPSPNASDVAKFKDAVSFIVPNITKHESGAVYLFKFGLNDFKQLPFKKDIHISDVAASLPGMHISENNNTMEPFSQTKKLSANNYIIFSSTEGQLYFYGADIFHSDYEIYTRYESNSIYHHRITVPTHIVTSEKIKQISSSKYHFSAVSFTGNVYMYGREPHMRFAGKSARQYSYERKITMPENDQYVAKALCSASFTLILSTRGNMYILGGYFLDINSIKDPNFLNHIKLDQKVKDIYVSSHLDYHYEYRNSTNIISGIFESGNLFYIDPNTAQLNSPFVHILDIDRYSIIEIAQFAVFWCHMENNFDKKGCALIFIIDNSGILRTFIHHREIIFVFIGANLPENNDERYVKMAFSTNNITYDKTKDLLKMQFNGYNIHTPFNMIAGITNTGRIYFMVVRPKGIRGGYFDKTSGHVDNVVFGNEGMVVVMKHTVQFPHFIENSPKVYNE